MMKWNAAGNILLWVLYPALAILTSVAASYEYWLLMGASLTGFQIGTIVLVCRAIARQVTIGTKELERLISR
jgi:hypothetical protein